MVIDDDPDLEGDPPPKPSHKVRADALERADRAWRARVAGGSWEQCAQVAGFTDAANCVRAVRNVYATLPDVERDDLRTLWRDRLERLWQQALEDALKQRSGAITSAVRVEQAAARLDGLDAPAQVEFHSPTKEALEQWVGRVLAKTVPQIEEPDIFDADSEWTGDGTEGDETQSR